MDSILFANFQTVFPRSGVISTTHNQSLPCTLTHYNRPPSSKHLNVIVNFSSLRRRVAALRSSGSATADTTNSVPHREKTYNVGDFMTRKERLHVVKPTTSVDEALEILVEKRITGFPVIDDDWNLVGVVSDYDLLALDSISGGGQLDTNMFPDVDSSWKTFNEIQKLLNKTYGRVIGDLMTSSPLVVRENTNLEDAVRLLLITKYHRLPVVDGDGKLVGIITRGDIVRAALQIKRANEEI